MCMQSQNHSDFWSVFLTKDGEVYCFGNNSYGELGNSDLSSRITPCKVKSFSNIEIR